MAKQNKPHVPPECGQLNDGGDVQCEIVYMQVVDVKVVNCVTKSDVPSMSAVILYLEDSQHEKNKSGM
jgi:hypothetical protein